LPGDALRRRRGRGRREDWRLAALGFVPPYRSRERSGRNVFQNPVRLEPYTRCLVVESAEVQRP
jgi:hypothetical protein